MNKNKLEIIDSLLDSNMDNGIDLSLITKLAHDYEVSIEEVSELAGQIYKCKKFNGELSNES